MHGKKIDSALTLNRSINQETPDAMTALDLQYTRLCSTPSDINEHLPILREVSSKCRLVTEFGVRSGVSTTALMAGRPQQLSCYDLHRHENVDRLAQMATLERVQFEFIQASTIKEPILISVTDFLFIDTLHTYSQLTEELRLHADRVQKYIAFHDVTTFGLIDEVPTTTRCKGLLTAILQFLASHPADWRIGHYNPSNNGLLIIERSF